jgi:hypothetical protein
VIGAVVAAITLVVNPLEGTAGDADKEQGTQILTGAFSGMEGVRVIPATSLSEVPGVQEALDACPKDDDACKARAFSVIRADGVVTAQFDVQGRRGIVRLALISTSTRGLVSSRVSRDFPEGGGKLAFQSLLTEMASELLPEQAKKSLGTIVFRGGEEGAALAIDGALTDTLKEGDSMLRVRPGEHQVRVTMKGRRPFETKVGVVVGQRTDVDVDLAKIRSNTPLVLGGIGVAAAIGGTLLGIAAKHIQSNWENGCPMGQACALGFTRDKYNLDRTTLNLEKGSADGLWVVSGIAIAAAAVWFLLDPGSDEP